MSWQHLLVYVAGLASLATIAITAVPNKGRIIAALFGKQVPKLPRSRPTRQHQVTQLRAVEASAQPTSRAA